MFHTTGDTDCHATNRLNLCQGWAETEFHVYCSNESRKEENMYEDQKTDGKTKLEPGDRSWRLD
jgi:hypothetical protein